MDASEHKALHKSMQIIYVFLNMSMVDFDSQLPASREKYRKYYSRAPQSYYNAPKLFLGVNSPFRKFLDLFEYKDGKDYSKAFTAYTNLRAMCEGNRVGLNAEARTQSAEMIVVLLKAFRLNLTSAREFVSDARACMGLVGGHSTMTDLEHPSEEKKDACSYIVGKMKSLRSLAIHILSESEFANYVRCQSQFEDLHKSLNIRNEEGKGRGAQRKTEFKDQWNLCESIIRKVVEGVDRAIAVFENFALQWAQQHPRQELKIEPASCGLKKDAETIDRELARIAESGGYDVARIADLGLWNEQRLNLLKGIARGFITATANLPARDPLEEALGYNQAQDDAKDLLNTILTLESVVNNFQNWKQNEEGKLEQSITNIRQAYKRTANDVSGRANIRMENQRIQQEEKIGQMKENYVQILDQNLSKFREEVSNLKEKISILEVALQRNSERSAKYASQLEKYEAENENLRRQSERLVEEHKTALQGRRKAASEAAYLRGENRAMRQQFGETNSMAAEELSQARDRARMAEQELESTRATIFRKSTDNERKSRNRTRDTQMLRQKIARRQLIDNRRRELLIRAGKRINQLKKQCKRLTKLVHSTRAESKEALARSGEAYAALERKMQSVQKQSAQNARKLTKYGMDARRELEQARAQNLDLENRLRDAEASASRSRDEAEQQREFSAEAKLSASELESRLESVMAELKASKETIRTVKAAAAETDRGFAKVTNLLLQARLDLLAETKRNVKLAEEKIQAEGSRKWWKRATLFTGAVSAASISVHLLQAILARPTEFTHYEGYYGGDYYPLLEAATASIPDAASSIYNVAAGASSITSAVTSAAGHAADIANYALSKSTYSSSDTGSYYV